MLVYAKFLAKQGRGAESDAVLAEAQQMEPNSPEIWYTKADLLIQQGRDLNQAKDLLVKYMHATITVDDPPKDDAERLLKQVGGA
jgi:Flp pilus assembly protein TadD